MGFYPSAMAWPLWPKSKIEFLNTPQGIITESGIWYQTTVDLLFEYAGELLERIPVEVHLARSDTWVRSPQTLSLWLLALGIVFYPPWLLSVVVLGFYLLWQIVAPAVVSLRLSPLLRILDSVFLQAVLYAATMSFLAISGNYTGVIIGLVGFLCLRWGVLSFLMRPLVHRCWNMLYQLPAPDHTLRAFIIRSALHNGVLLDDFKSIEESIIQTIQKK